MLENYYTHRLKKAKYRSPSQQDMTYFKKVIPPVLLYADTLLVTFYILF